MARPKKGTTTRGSKTINATDQHRAWLELVDTEGPFLAIPPLKRVWPQGMPSLTEERKIALVDARKDFEAAWESLDRSPGWESAQDSYRVARDKWVETILRDVAGWAESLSWGEVPGLEAQSPNRAVAIRAQAALNGADGLGAIVHVIDSVDSLRQTPGDLWAANPIDRVEVMLRENKVPIGIVTDGRWWGLVCAREGAMAASGIVDALTWIEEPRTRDAFFALIGRQHLIGGDPTERLPVLFEESVAAAEEITEALGAQVRRAVELLIQSFSESAADAQRRGLPDPLPTRTHDSYEAAVTVMMRAVFLLFAEERGLLPSGELFEQGYGIARELDRLIARETEESEEALDATSLTWHRLLATSQALYQGASFENLRMPAYGGSLFDPARFPFLIGINEQGTLAITVSDRVMLHVLRSVQVADIKGEARRISFRDIDVEQIGYIYEGLLGYTAAIAREVTVGLKGTLGEEPEIPLATLEALAEEHSDPKKLAAAIRSFVESDQPSAKPSSAAAIAKAIGAGVEPTVVSALTQAVGDDLALRDRVKPWLGLIRLDLRQRPFVVLDGGLVVKETPSRKNAGAHYTPKSLAEEVVLHALQPLCYSPGPHQTANEEEWKLKSSDELLSLKVADIACGSGAFLVAAARYLAERVVEAWTAEDPRNAARKDLYTRAIRQVVANCLYGADINDMAVEMCKLSLWLVSLDRDLPFSFVDDKVFLGNSLLGVTDLNQLRRLHIDPTAKTEMAGYYAYDVDIDSIIDRAKGLRRALLTEIDEKDPARTSAAKRRQLADFRQVTSDLRQIADGVVAVGLSQGGKPGKALNEAYDNLRIAVGKAYPDKGEADDTFLTSLVDSGLRPTVVTDYERWQPLHWVLEAPDVIIDNGGFDAVIGNPPFLGAPKITPAVGSNVREWFLNQIAGGAKGAADLVAYFFLRAASLLEHEQGQFGLIATNTLAQGDTRQVGLDQLEKQGFVIVRSIQSAPWPAASANLEFAAVWATNAARSESALSVADGVPVPRISTLLEAEGRTSGHPLRLAGLKGIAFKGAEPGSMAFTLTPEEAADLAREAPNESDVIRRFVNGEDLNTSPACEGSRYIIDFGLMSVVDVERYPKTQERLARALGINPAASGQWWRFRRPGPDLRKAIAALDHVIALALVSKAVMPVRVATGPVFSKNLAVFATDSFADLAILSSNLHQLWAIKYSSTLETRVNYSPTDAFETFPMPAHTQRLEELGHELDAQRRSIMMSRSLGVTKLYNLVNDPDLSDSVDAAIGRLRALHREIDLAVVDGYGWRAIELEHGFHEYRQVVRWSPSPAGRLVVLDLLLEENHKRAGTQGVSRGKRMRAGGGPRNASQGSLFGDE